MYGSFSRIRSTFRLATHLGGRVLDGQPPKQPQDKWQGRARQKLFPDVSIQTAKQRKAYKQAREAKLLGNRLLILACLNTTLQECHKESPRTT